MAAPSSADSRLEKIVSAIVTSHDCILETLSVRRAGRRLLVQITVDNETHLDLDVVAKISREIDHELEISNHFGEQAYTLEVSSPGVDRPLTLPRHFRTNLDRLVKIQLVAGTEFSARISEVDETSVYFEDHDSVLFAEIASAQVQIEFNRKGKGAADELDDLIEDEADED